MRPFTRVALGPPNQRAIKNRPYRAAQDQPQTPNRPKCQCPGGHFKISVSHSAGDDQTPEFEEDPNPQRPPDMAPRPNMRADHGPNIADGNPTEGIRHHTPAPVSVPGHPDEHGIKPKRAHDEDGVVECVGVWVVAECEDLVDLADLAVEPDAGEDEDEGGVDVVGVFTIQVN